MNSGRLVVQASFVLNAAEGAGVVITDGEYQLILSPAEGDQLAEMVRVSSASAHQMAAAAQAHPAILTSLAISGIGRA